MAMSRVQITGGAEFIGSRLSDELLAHGYAVRVLDSLIPQVHDVDRRAAVPRAGRPNSSRVTSATRPRFAGRCAASMPSTTSPLDAAFSGGSLRGWCIAPQPAAQATSEASCIAARETVLAGSSYTADLPHSWWLHRPPDVNLCKGVEL